MMPEPAPRRYAVRLTVTERTRWERVLWWEPAIAPIDTSPEAIASAVRAAVEAALLKWARTPGGHAGLFRTDEPPPDDDELTDRDVWMRFTLALDPLWEGGFRYERQLQRKSSRTPLIEVPLTGLATLLRAHGIRRDTPPQAGPTGVPEEPALARPSSLPVWMALALPCLGALLIAMSIAGAHVPFFGNDVTAWGLGIGSVVAAGWLGKRIDHLRGHRQALAEMAAGAGWILCVIGLVAANANAPKPAPPPPPPHLVYWQCGDGSHAAQLSQCPFFNGPYPQRSGAVCRDGWDSEATGQGACSYHGGVAHWVYDGPFPSPLPFPSPVYSGS